MKRLRIGFVGVGAWASQLREAFEQQEGVEIWGYYRKNASEPAIGFGNKMWDWKALCRSVDLMVVAATPEPTTEIAMWCAENCIPVVATKPLLKHPIVTVAPFFVDLWRFWSPPYRMMREILRGQMSQLLGRQIQRVEIDFHGDGPHRSYLKGLDDWGPHALGYLASILGISDVPNMDELKSVWSTDEKGGELFTLLGKIQNVEVAILTGNASPEPKRCVRVFDSLDDVHTLSEKDGEISYELTSTRMRVGPGVLRSTKEIALGMFARAVLSATRSFHQDGTIYLSQTFVCSLIASQMIQKMRGIETSPTGVLPRFDDVNLN